MAFCPFLPFVNNNIHTPASRLEEEEEGRKVAVIKGGLQKLSSVPIINSDGDYFNLPWITLLPTYLIPTQVYTVKLIMASPY